MSNKYIVRTVVWIILIAVIFYGYKGWNTYLDKQYEVEGVNWAVPLSVNQDYKLRDRQMLEHNLNEMGLKAVYAANPGVEKRDYVPEYLIGAEDRKGKLVIPMVCESMEVFAEEGYILVGYYDKEGSIYRYYRPDGSLLNETAFSYAQPFENGYAYVMDKDRNFLMDTEGRMAIETSKEELRVLDAEKGLIRFSQAEEQGQNGDSNIFQGIMDFKGNVLLDPRYDNIQRDGRGGLMVTYTEEETGQSVSLYVDAALQPTTNRQYNDITAFESGAAVASDQKGWHIIDENEKNIADIGNCVDVNAFSEAICVVEYEDRLEYLDTRGEVQFTVPYKTTWGMAYDMRYFSEGYILFKGKNQKLGYMNKLGDVVIKPVFDYAYAVKDRRAAVEINNRSGAVLMPLAK